MYKAVSCFSFNALCGIYIDRQLGLGVMGYGLWKIVFYANSTSVKALNAQKKGLYIRDLVSSITEYDLGLLNEA